MTVIEFLAVSRDGLDKFDSESDDESSEDDDELSEEELEAFSDSSDDELSTRAFLAFVGLSFRLDFLTAFCLTGTSSESLLELLSIFAFGSFFYSLKVTFCCRFSFSFPTESFTATFTVSCVTLTDSSKT